MLDDERLHRGLVGVPGSRAQLNTPVLIVEIDALDRNIAKMAAFAQAQGVRLRPHAKTHKSVEIARRQMAAGAVGVCCAKLGEAEALAAGGIPSILITSPVVHAPVIARLVQLQQQLSELIVVLDNASNAARLAQAFAGRRLQVLIDVDPGIKRTGVATPQAALDLYRALSEHPELQFRGLQYYCGLQQHVAAYAERRSAVQERTQYLTSVIELLAANGAQPEVISGSGTGTVRLDAALGVLNEWQVGSYVFMDRQYAECDLVGDGSADFEHALFVDTRVVSANTPGVATCDAGFKALATDAGAPGVVQGAPAASTYHFMGDEHGLVVDPKLAHTWQLSDPLTLTVPHCDPTVNLYDAYHVVRADALVDIWPVTARGRSR